MRIGIMARTDKREAIEVSKKVIQTLTDHILFLDDELLKYLKGEKIKNVDCLIVIGGDGMILRAMRKYGKPTIGVRIAKHGFLCELSPNEIPKLKKILSDHTVEKRTKLSVENFGEALNEMVVRSKSPTKVASLVVEYGDKKEEIVGDGVIVSTPTGSTAYSYAAGGPVVDKDSKVFLITPLCSFLRRNPVRVVPDHLRIKITLRDKICSLAMDGEYIKDVVAGDSILVLKSENHAEFWRKKR
ncbi:MAG: NAD(+)/NADH kinase [Candidatus Methanofastidiosia archaeon]